MSEVTATYILDPETHTVASVQPISGPHKRKTYTDRQFEGGESEWKKKLETSTTVYIGNLSCYTNEYQLYELFSRCGSIKRIIMGLDSVKKTPCGFCFVEYDDRESAVKSINYLHLTRLDGRSIEVDIDAGFKEGRQFGRGAKGGQLGDERKRERESEGHEQGGRRGGGWNAPVLTRSITIISCITLISLMLVLQQPDLIGARVVMRAPVYSRSYYANAVFNVRQAQLTERREIFEKNFAQFLVNLLKSSKPSLLSAFMKATLADKVLREQALAIFFNNTDTDTDNDR